MSWSVQIPPYGDGQPYEVLADNVLTAISDAQVIGLDMTGGPERQLIAAKAAARALVSVGGPMAGKHAYRIALSGHCDPGDQTTAADCITVSVSEVRQPVAAESSPEPETPAAQDPAADPPFNSPVASTGETSAVEPEPAEAEPAAEQATESAAADPAPESTPSAAVPDPDPQPVEAEPQPEQAAPTEPQGDPAVPDPVGTIIEPDTGTELHPATPTQEG